MGKFIDLLMDVERTGAKVTLHRIGSEEFYIVVPPRREKEKKPKYGPWGTEKLPRRKKAQPFGV